MTRRFTCIHFMMRSMTTSPATMMSARSALQSRHGPPGCQGQERADGPARAARRYASSHSRRRPAVLVPHRKEMFARAVNVPPAPIMKWGRNAATGSRFAREASAPACRTALKSAAMRRVVTDARLGHPHAADRQGVNLLDGPVGGEDQLAAAPAEVEHEDALIASDRSAAGRRETKAGLLPPG